jgi:hypothetical protein
MSFDRIPRYAIKRPVMEVNPALGIPLKRRFTQSCGGAKAARNKRLRSPGAEKTFCGLRAFVCEPLFVAASALFAEVNALSGAHAFPEEGGGEACDASKGASEVLGAAKARL